jgi:hypothetical protein
MLARYMAQGCPLLFSARGAPEDIALGSVLLKIEHKIIGFFPLIPKEENYSRHYTSLCCQAACPDSRPSSFSPFGTHSLVCSPTKLSRNNVFCLVLVQLHGWSHNPGLQSQCLGKSMYPSRATIGPGARCSGSHL